MADCKYSISVTDNMAKASGRFIDVSVKKAVELCNHLRGKRLDSGLKFLDYVIEKKIPVKYSRYQHGGTGHKAGIGPGRYPVKTCIEIKKILKSAEANAEQKGLDVKSLFIRHISAQKAPIAWHYGRFRRRRMKRSHLEVVLAESIEKSKHKAGDKK